MGIPYNEKAAWTDLEAEQKSYVVRILNWFHFRPKQLAHSWTREEVLTWELYRALETLPQRFFLGPLLDRAGSNNPSLVPLLKNFSKHAGQLQLEAYPSLQLKGALRNRRSDIGVTHPDGSQIWIEAKTVAMSSTALQDLHQQVQDQQDALDRISAGRSSKVIALVPSGTAMERCPAFTWADVLEVLSKTLTELVNADNEQQDFSGYQLIARELQDRIWTHPNSIVL